MNRTLRSALIAAILAAAGVWGELIGAMVCVAVGAGAAAVVSRMELPHAGDPPSGSPFVEFRPWLLGTTMFAGFVVVLIPFTLWPAITLGLLLFAPVFGTMVFVIERAVSVILFPSSLPTRPP